MTYLTQNNVIFINIFLIMRSNVIRDFFVWDSSNFFFNMIYEYKTKYALLSVGIYAVDSLSTFH